MSNKFKSGDKVTLETGGNVMTIKGYARIHKANDTAVIANKYECEWYDGRKTQQAVFLESSLRLVK